MESYGLGHAPSAYYSWQLVVPTRPKSESPSAGWRAIVPEPGLALRLAARDLGRFGRLIHLTHPHQG